MAKSAANLDGLAKLRESFPPEKISKLPKPTKKQTEEVKKDFTKGARCNICGGWHHPKVVHLDYVGHAATTDRLLEADPLWNWDFMSPPKDGFPVLDANNGLWIYLTVCGVTRKGYGNAPGKTGPDVMKEIIGDAIRNAAMRFGVALDLWSKENLHDNKPQDDAPQDTVEYLDEEKFQDLLPKWAQSVADGKTPATILKFLAKKGYNFSPVQTKKITSLRKKK